MEHHLPQLIQDLALILIAAAAVTIIFKKIRQPLVLGYIIAGFFVGPYFSFFPNIVDASNVSIWANIGVIFLLFSLGLEFSFKKLIKVGGSASITAFVEIIFIVTLGFFAGQWMGWNYMDSLFLGGMLASSSTTIIIKAFDELGVKHKKYARIVFGVLVVEDIVVILLMVLLSTLAVSQQFNGNELMFAIAKLIFFLITIYLTGIYVLPTIFRLSRKVLDDEMMLIISIGLCFGLVVLATKAGLSAELGAFLMGTILGETLYSEKVEHLIKPMKDLFGAVFFISIGMMIDPAAMLAYKWPILIITLLTLVGKFMLTTFGAVLSGQPFRQSVQVGASMAQIGEFAFIVAALGLSLNVTSDFLFPVAVGVSAITTFTTPYMISYSDHIHRFMEKMTPNSMLRAIDKYSDQFQTIQQESGWKKLIKSYFATILLNTVVIVALVLGGHNLLMPFLEDYLANSITARIITLCVVILASVPFLWAITIQRIQPKVYKELWKGNYFSRGPMVLVDLLRILIGIIIVQFIIYRFYPSLIVSVLGIPLTLLFLYFLSTKIQSLHNLIVKRFLYNFYERDIYAKEKLRLEKDDKEKYKRKIDSLWSTYVAEFEVGQYAEYIGKRLDELAWRENFGINVAYIKRGEKVVYTPNAHDRIFPFDKIGLLGDEEHIRDFENKKFRMEEVGQNFVTQTGLEDFVLMNFLVTRNASFLGKSIKEIELREKTDGLVVGIERDGKRLLNPPSATILLLNDLVWIVGNKKLIHQFMKENNL
ncbi:cation:proton antiporter [Haoranjiania flava]|uniref:Cation:proton antiporter n=1 Tax=Haoranjiania flava TaxID=1856322 RepID=A0AAE3INC7_9BACT|nr:cation:proton antiporter [Haoranjiania flava]MCU7695049.1 cation:proton antiporter [Haoranjiania flava]